MVARRERGQRAEEAKAAFMILDFGKGRRGWDTRCSRKVLSMGTSAFAI